MTQLSGNTIFHIGLAVMIAAGVLAVLYLLFNIFYRRRLRRQLELEYGEKQKRQKTGR